MTAVPTANAQGEFTDLVIESPELAAAIAEMKASEEAAKTHRKHRATFQKLFKALNVQAGTRVVVDNFAIEVVERRGGGFEIPAWTANVVGSVYERE